MYMKRILTILASVAMVMAAVSCETEQTPSLTFGKSHYVLQADAPLTVDLVTDIAPAADLTVELAFTGTAVEGTDYSVSAKSVVIAAGQTTGSVTITPEQNYSADKTIEIAMLLPAGYEAGNYATATVAVEAKEVLLYSFAVEQANVSDKYTVKLNLTGVTTGDKWVATADMEIPYTVTPDAGDALEFADDAFVVKKGSNVATLEVNAGVVEGEPKTFAITVDEASAGAGFSSGTNESISLTVVGQMRLSKLVGTWEFAETLDLEELELWFMEMEDDPELLPTHNEGFKFTIAENAEDGTYTITPSGEGDWMKYFQAGSITYTVPVNICAKGVVTGAYTAMENQMFVEESEGVADLEYTYFKVSPVYRNFNGDASASGEGVIAITYDADYNLIIMIRDYDQPPFGEMWWDPGYEPDMFSFASRFVKAE